MNGTPTPWLLAIDLGYYINDHGGCFSEIALHIIYLYLQAMSLVYHRRDPPLVLQLPRSIITCPSTTSRGGGTSSEQESSCSIAKIGS